MNISNQKEYTKLKILIWNTPLLTLGTYISISTGAGFILSYLVTYNISKGYNLKPKEELKYKAHNETYNENLYEEDNELISYNNTLIERDVKDPLPTLKAKFRVIGKTNNRKQQSSQSKYYNKEQNADLYDASDSVNNNQEKPYQDDSFINTSFNDWEDDTYINW
tara:strand:- start:104 stop:598 length:495 start_codon:yes stop_codon:yes gene_type:complete